MYEPEYSETQWNPQGLSSTRYWICYVEGTDGGRRYRHYTYQSATTEAERLARQIGKEVSIFEFRGSCKVTLPPVSWSIPN
jgi:hypothetical protein